MDKELKGSDLTLTAVIMLTGIQGKDWAYYINDLNWWTLRFYTRRN